MTPRDLAGLALGTLRADPLRGSLTALGIAVGIAAVVLLTSIGEGAHRFLLSEFTQFGTNLIDINPGKAKTAGTAVGMFGNVRPLTVEDAQALTRIAAVEAADPVVQGNGEVEAGGRTRRTTILGVGHAFPRVFRMRVAAGSFLPAGEAGGARAFAVLGARLRQELFGASNPLGARVRVGQSRYRVAGVMESKGQMLGFDLDDVVYIPAEQSLALFNRESLMGIHVTYAPGAPVERVVRDIRRTLLARHGREDFTITPQQQMIDTLSSVLNVITFAVAALGSVSLLVGAVGIVTIMTIAVDERTGEIGLLRALGATRGNIQAIFLAEAVLLCALGGLAGLALGAGIGQALRLAVPALPVHTPWSYALLAEAMAIAVGVAAGILPARRAAALDPVEALRAI